MVLSCSRSFIFNIVWKNADFAFFLGVIVVCSYIAQGLVNNPTVFLAPYLFLMLGIIKSMERDRDAEK